MLELIFGLIILGIVIFIALRVFHSIALGSLLVALVFFASYLILGSLPDLQAIPIIGKYIPELPKTTGEFIAIIKEVAYSIDVIGTSRDAENNLLITVANTGRGEVSGFKVFVDDQPVRVTNVPQDPLPSGQTTVIQVDWKGNFTKVMVQADQTSAMYTIN